MRRLKLEQIADYLPKCSNIARGDPDALRMMRHWTIDFGNSSAWLGGIARQLAGRQAVSPEVDECGE
jgi:hypothetical protein